MIEIKENRAEIVLGDEDVQIRIHGEQDKTILEFKSFDEEQVVRICLPEANLKNTIDSLNYFYYTKYFTKTAKKETAKTIKAVDEFKNSKVQAINKEDQQNAKECIN